MSLQEIKNTGRQMQKPFSRNHRYWSETFSHIELGTEYITEFKGRAGRHG